MYCLSNSVLLCLGLSRLGNAFPSSSRLLPREDISTDDDISGFETLDIASLVNIYDSPPSSPIASNISYEKQNVALAPTVPVAVGSTNTEKRAEGDNYVDYWTRSGILKSTRQKTVWYPDNAPTAALISFFAFVEEVATAAWHAQAPANGTEDSTQWYLIVQGDLSFFAAVDTNIMTTSGLSFCWGDVVQLAQWMGADCTTDAQAEYGWNFWLLGEKDKVVFADGHIGYSFVPDQAYTPPGNKRSLDSKLNESPDTDIVSIEPRTASLQKRMVNLGLESLAGWYAHFRNNRNVKISQQFMFFLLTRALNQLNAGLPSGRSVNEFIVQIPQASAQGIQDAAKYGFHMATTDPTKAVPIQVIMEIVTKMIAFAGEMKWNEATGDRYTLTGQISTEGETVATWSLGPLLDVAWKKGIGFLNPDGSTSYGAFVHP